jgi:hypothetical protein
MRIDGTTWTGNPDRTIPQQGNAPAGALIPAGFSESRRGQSPPSPHVAPHGFALVHDALHGAVVIDLFHAALRAVEVPTYRISRDGAFEIDAKPRKGGIIDLVA